MKPIVGFVGMTHLGLVSATGTCSKGFDVVCVDADASLVTDLQSGKLPVVEPALDDMLRSNGSKQRFSSDFGDLAACDVVYVAPDVPTDDDGRSELSGIRQLIGAVIPHLNASAFLVVLCQVPPGFTRQLDFPAGRLFYQVETLIFGRAVERAVEPERFIIGSADPEGELPEAYSVLLEAFGCPILNMRYESAELAKISINMCLVASIGVANTMAEVCENVGADWAEIVPALKLDRRIGPYSYLAPGLGLAGGNLERDLATVMRLSEEHETDSGIVAAWLDNSRHRRDWAVKAVRREVLDVKLDVVVAVWGLAYKENTHSVKNSPSLATISQMRDVRLQLHDPVVSADVVDHPMSTGAESALDAVRDADALMVLTPWPEYADIDIGAVADTMRGCVVIDPYGVFERKDVTAAGLRYLTLGVPAIG